MTVLTESFVLKKKLRGESDRHYVLFTKELGKINVLAKGAAKITSKLAPHLEFFSLSEVMLAPGAIGYRLAGAKIKTAYKNLNRNLFKSVLTNVFLELVDLLLIEKAAEEKIFLLVEDFFDGLEVSSSGRQSVIIFNKSLFGLLSISGYEPPLSVSSQTELSIKMVESVQEISNKRLMSLPALKRILISA